MSRDRRHIRDMALRALAKADAARERERTRAPEPPTLCACDCPVTYWARDPETCRTCGLPLDPSRRYRMRSLED